MDKTIWKKILESMPNEDFIKLTNACDINVKGFRKISHENYKVVKQKLLVEALKNNNLKRITMLFDKKSEFLSLNDTLEDEDVDFRSMSLEELFETYENGSELFEILGSLHSSSNPEHINLAIEFEKQLSLKNSQIDLEEESIIEIVQEQHQDDMEQLKKQILEARKAISNLEKKVTKSLQKNTELQTRFNHLEVEYSTAKKNWKEEKKEWTKSKTMLQQEVVTKQNQINKFDIQKEELQNKIKLQEKDLLEKNAKISHLNAKLLNSNQPQNESTLQQDSLINSNTHTKTDRKKRIAIIGNPKNKRIEENSHFKVEVFEVSELEKAFETNTFEAFDEIWLLTYKVPTTKQKLVHEQLKKPIVEISTFINLRTKVEKG
jgi:murein DD-endopeptidase MepM/ murein hydrolase activator NlpD